MQHIAKNSEKQLIISDQMFSTLMSLAVYSSEKLTSNNVYVQSKDIKNLREMLNASGLKIDERLELVNDRARVWRLQAEIKRTEDKITYYTEHLSGGFGEQKERAQKKLASDQKKLAKLSAKIAKAMEGGLN